MTSRRIAAARAGGGAAVALLGLAIPVSVAADGVLAALALLAWLAALPASARASYSTVRASPALLAALALFALLAASALHAPVAPKTSWGSLSKYLDLALIAVFAWAASTSPRARAGALGAFLIAIAASLAISYGTAAGLWNWIPGLRTHSHYPVGFKLSVTHNVLVTLGAFAALLLARELHARGNRWALAAAAFALVCIYNVLFIVIGRTGYVILAVLLLYFALTVVRGRRDVLLTVLILSGLFASAYHASQYFPARVLDVASDLSEWRAGGEDTTSVGQRIGYYATTLEIVREHPLTGVGTGAFASAYAEKVRGTSAPATTNPHNDYLMLAAQGGLPAAALLIALYALLWRESTRLGSPFERDIMRGLVLTMAIGGMFNTLIMDHVEGMLFAWSVGLLYAGRTAAARA